VKIEADHSCRWCVSINVMELPDRLESFKKREPSTAIIEQQAQQLVAMQFQPRELRDFIKAVCKWGGYEGWQAVSSKTIASDNSENLSNPRIFTRPATMIARQ
jgi:hypothetical protein